MRALFSGQHGAGKTLASEVVAAHLPRGLRDLDLGDVLSKYSGETEKNLWRVFNETEALDFFLLFDEANAILGRRTEVRNARNRYANLKADYLLQRIENYWGFVVLATNLRGSIDFALNAAWP